MRDDKWRPRPLVNVRRSRRSHRIGDRFRHAGQIGRRARMHPSRRRTPATSTTSMTSMTTQASSSRRVRRLPVRACVSSMTRCAADVLVPIGAPGAIEPSGGDLPWASIEDVTRGLHRTPLARPQVGDVGTASALGHRAPKRIVIAAGERIFACVGPEHCSADRVHVKTRAHASHTRLVRPRIVRAVRAVRVAIAR